MISPYLSSIPMRTYRLFIQEIKATSSSPPDSSGNLMHPAVALGNVQPDVFPPANSVPFPPKLHTQNDIPGEA
jgi:hypothetical protein